MAVRDYERRLGLWLNSDVRAWLDYITDPDFDVEAYNLANELETPWSSEF